MQEQAPSLYFQGNQVLTRGVFRSFVNFQIRFTSAKVKLKQDLSSQQTLPELIHVPTTYKYLVPAYTQQNRLLEIFVNT